MGIPYPWDGNGNDFFPVWIPIGIPIGIPMGIPIGIPMGIPTGFLWEWDGNGNGNSIPTATVVKTSKIFDFDLVMHTN